MTKIRSRSIKKIAAAAMSAALAFTMVLSTPMIPQVKASHTTYAASFSDTRNHWANTFVEKAVGYGFVNGYSDGTFKPDNSITRAEFAKMLNSALGNDGTTSLDFWDVSSSDWFYNDVQKGVAAGYISGYSETEFQPTNKITRQEAAVMMARIIPAYGAASTLKAFDDYTDAGDWAESALEKMVSKEYIGAYNDGKLHPTAQLTRAQAAKIIVTMLEKETIVKNNQTVVLDGVVLKDTIYANRISIGADVGDSGSVTMSNCTVLGTFNVAGGSGSTDKGITVINSRIANANIHKDSSAVRVYAKGETTIKNSSVTGLATLETGALSGKGDYGQGFVNVTAGRAAELDLVGDFQNVTVTGSKVDLSLKGGTLDTLNVDSGATQMNVTVESGATISNADVYAAETSFAGTGHITRLNAYANGITYETEPTKTTTGKDVTEAPYKKVDVERLLTITPTPAEGATKISTGENIVLEFSSPVHLTDTNYTGLTDAQAESIVTFRKNSSSGTVINFAAVVSSDYKKITLTPDDDLSEDTKYFIRIAAGELTDTYGNENALFTTNFTTGTASLDTTFSPSNGSTSVSLAATPMITFNEAVVRYGTASTSITSTYLENSVLTFEKRGPNDTKRTSVSFDATIDSANRIISIAPTSSLAEETTYYLTINGDTLMRASDNQSVPEKEIQFTTVSNSVSSRVASAIGADQARLTFKAMQKGTVYGIIFPQNELSSARPTADTIINSSYTASTSKKGHYASAKISSAGNSGTLNFSNLEPSTNYYIYTVLVDNSDNAYTVFSDSVTTSTNTPTLSSLQVSMDSESSYIALDVQNLNTTNNFYIGNNETTLYVKSTASTSVTNPTYTASFDAANQNVSVSNSNDIAKITIPSGTTDPGTIKVKVSSADSGYGTNTYSIVVRRINSGIKSATIDGTIVTPKDSDDTSALKLQPEGVTMGAITDTDTELKLVASLSEATYTAGVTYTVYKYDGSNWTLMTAASGVSSGTTVSLGKRDQANLTNNTIYKIVTKTKIGGTSTTNGTLSESSTQYLSILYKKAANTTTAS